MDVLSKTEREPFLDVNTPKIEKGNRPKVEYKSGPVPKWCGAWCRAKLSSGLMAITGTAHRAQYAKAKLEAALGEGVASG